MGAKEKTPVDRRCAPARVGLGTDLPQLSPPGRERKRERESGQGGFPLCPYPFRKKEREGGCGGQLPCTPALAKARERERERGRTKTSLTPCLSCLRCGSSEPCSSQLRLVARHPQSLHWAHTLSNTLLGFCDPDGMHLLPALLVT